MIVSILASFFVGLSLGYYLTIMKSLDLVADLGNSLMVTVETMSNYVKLIEQKNKDRVELLNEIVKRSIP